MGILFRQHIEQIVPVTDAEFDYILTHFSSREMKRYQFVVQEGNAVEYEYFVVSGLMKAYFINESGKEHIIQFAMENWWISDYQALYSAEKATLNIDCIEQTSLLCITLANKNKLCSELHKMEHFFRVKTSVGYLGLQKRILSFLNDDAKSRYNHLLQQYPALFQRVPKTLIASYLGVSRETLSRLSA
ncbi:Crp/Fnr family transcriptional regulator [Flavitalea flava]